MVNLHDGANSRSQIEKKFLIVGKPNSGKSLLFNRLTGLNHTVANFPGVTVQVHSGQVDGITLLDFPGVYSMNPITKDEQVAVDKLSSSLKDPTVIGVLCLLDATRLERSLLLGLQVVREAISHQKPVMFAVNMMDDIRKNGVSIDLKALAKELGCRVVGISAKTGEGIAELKGAMASNKLALPTVSFPQNVGGLAKELGQKFGPKTDVLLRNQNKLDSFFLSSVWGGLAFIAIMVFLFQAIFTWSAPAMDFVEGLVSALGAWIGSKVPVGMFRDFVSEAIFGGFGSFLVFVPQIFVLTFIIGILEDSGYLVRAAIICHRPLSLFGLSGKSFVPLLSGHACAIPAVFATRTIESPRRRLLTIMTLPLMSCSARLPVYSLLIGALIPATTYLGGLVGLQGLSFFGLYAFGLVAGLVVSGLTSATSLWKKESDAPFVLELPPYRIPSWRPLLKRSVTYASDFITKAGLTIFTVTVVVWVLGYFPNGSGQLSSSWLAQLGKSIEWLFTPLGLDWKYGVAVIASFLAREVFVGTLGTLLGIESADENISDLANSISASGLTLASGVALLVFYAIAMQCVSTLAVIRRETGSSKLPILLFLGYGLLAYTLAFFAYRIFS